MKLDLEVEQLNLGNSIPSDELDWCCETQVESWLQSEFLADPLWNDLHRSLGMGHLGNWGFQ